MLIGLVSFLGLTSVFIKGGKPFPVSLMLHSSCFPWLNRRAQTGSDDFNITAGGPQGVTVALIVVSNGSVMVVVVAVVSNGSVMVVVVAVVSNGSVMVVVVAVVVILAVVVVAAVVVVLPVVNSNCDEQNNRRKERKNRKK